jgi:hypothetical protein
MPDMMTRQPDKVGSSRPWRDWKSGGPAPRLSGLVLDGCLAQGTYRNSSRPWLPSLAVK